MCMSKGLKEEVEGFSIANLKPVLIYLFIQNFPERFSYFLIASQYKKGCAYLRANKIEFDLLW